MLILIWLVCDSRLTMWSGILLSQPTIKLPPKRNGQSPTYIHLSNLKCKELKIGLTYARMESAATTVILHLESMGWTGRVRWGMMLLLHWRIQSWIRTLTTPSLRNSHDPLPKGKLKHFPFPSATPHESLRTPIFSTPKTQQHLPQSKQTRTHQPEKPKR